LEFRYLPLDLIDVSEHNVRRSKIEASIEELQQSIRQIGVQQPVMVMRKGDRYELIIGQRRFLASKLAGETDIPAVITSAKNSTDAAIASFSENIHRQELAYRDKMDVAIQLLQQLGSVGEVAKRLGVSSQSVRNYMGYAAVPEEIKRMVDAKKLSATTASRISRAVSDQDHAIRIAEKVVEEPRSEDRERMIGLARENPDKTPAELAKIAKKSRFRQVTVDLTPAVADALERACEDYRADPPELVTYAVELWLSNQGFV
jgi:ParB family chromosome partitioning protein